mmetsp:Transcript_26352/g.51929  ORF Transcript_26352/g.51929 Transcript_26352/m.51929 type:complete len:116 (+) Transcript_26352:181-528(+)
MFRMAFLPAGATCPIRVAVWTFSQGLVTMLALGTLLTFLALHVGFAHSLRFLLSFRGFPDRGTVRMDLSSRRWYSLFSGKGFDFVDDSGQGNIYGGGAIFSGVYQIESEDLEFFG